MTSALQHADGDAGARCFRCGAIAAGPCASCHEPVCGDCSVLTEGGARVWAICLACADRKGRNLSDAWRGLVLWLVAILVGLALVTWILGRLVGYEAKRSGVNAVSPGATSTCSIPARTNTGYKRSSTWGAASSTGSDRRGSRRFAARPRA